MPEQSENGNNCLNSTCSYCNGKGEVERECYRGGRWTTYWETCA